MEKKACRNVDVLLFFVSIFFRFCMFQYVDVMHNNTSVCVSVPFHHSFMSLVFLPFIFLRRLC